MISGRDGVSVFWRAPDGTGNYYGMNAWTQIQNEVDVADMTGDGLPDIVGVVRNILSVFPQTPGHAFGPPVQYAVADSWPSANGLAVGDLNHDGLADVAVSTWFSPGVEIKLFVQTETGTLSGPSLYESYGVPDPLEIADLDGDGDNDLIAANLGTHQWGVVHRAGFLRDDVHRPRGSPTTGSTAWRWAISTATASATWPWPAGPTAS